MRGSSAPVCDDHVERVPPLLVYPILVKILFGGLGRRV